MTSAIEELGVELDSENSLNGPNVTTRMAQETTALSPRFYTTDYDELDATDVSPVRKEWDALIDYLKSDKNRNHFKRGEDWDFDPNSITPELRKELIDFMVSSLTAEFSGCVLYAEMKKRGSNPDIKELFRCMARDEARHAGFINDALKDFDIGVDLGFLTKKKQYTFFRPKFIFYATYLSEKIGYARYITIFRLLQQHPEYRFHPIFKWFEEWCTDEFTHGEAFALLMRANTKLLSGVNRLWIRFFQLAVFSTMWVRDHRRRVFHKALGLDPSAYGMKVFQITLQISRQVFPVLLDIESPAFRRGLDSLKRIDDAIARAEEKGGVWAKARVFGLKIRAGMVFLRLFARKPQTNQLPELSRLYPVW